MTNFDYLLNEEKFKSFAEVAVAAEMAYTDPSQCVVNSQKAMEIAVKWMYSVDGSLIMPYQEGLLSLMSTEEFCDLVDINIRRRMDYIRKLGNTASQSPKKITSDKAKLCIENLFYFLDLIAYYYSDNYAEKEFNADILEDKSIKYKDYADFEISASDLINCNKDIRQGLTAKRKDRQKTYCPKPLDISEYNTRKLYIDVMLEDAGWTLGRDWMNEVELYGMPNNAGVGYADYVLYSDDGRALAIIEAKRTCVDVAKGRQQAKLYADLLEKKHGRRPVIFLTNGFDTRIDDGQFPERKVATFYSKRDLEKMFNLRTLKTSLNNVMVDKNIAGRYYQEGAIKAVCDAFGKKNRRKALLVMATGSGKTRTVIALCKILLEHGWVKNILFLADRNSLVTQAKRNFVNLLPDQSITNLCEDHGNCDARCVLSTYQTMYNCIDNVKDDGGKIFTVGHFDLVICDEAHRSIYNKYQDIFNYFDAPLVGLTATPKDEIDKNTYEVFELENGVPTYGYELNQAVKDGYLVDFMSVETKLKFIEEGIVYDDLPDDEKEEYENTFEDENGDIPSSISSSALNDWVFNEDTIKQVLHFVMDNGLRIDYGQKIGKTIIFAKSHAHAERIFEIFNKEYPHLPGFAKVIDNYMTYAQSAIDEFSDARKLPEIAISVDMLDTGIDVPEVLNLVFFKKVMSKAKFWQMIGRGTRLCEGLINGANKNKFYIFDFCGNFEFFRMGKGKTTTNTVALQSAIFNLKTQIVLKLQDIAYQHNAFLVAFRKRLVNELVGKVQELDRDNFAVRQHIRYVDTYSSVDGFRTLSYEDTLLIADELAPLIIPDGDDVSAVRFDALMYGIEVAYLVGKTNKKARNDLMKRVEGIASVANIPEIIAQSELINKILHTDFVETAGINDFEFIRENLRDLIKYIPKSSVSYVTNFDDNILDSTWHESELDNGDLENYKKKVEHYIRQHQDEATIAKLKSNQPLTQEDIDNLEKILWEDLGSKSDYESEYGNKPLGEFVREIVGLDMRAAKEAFSEFLSHHNLDSRQIYFVNQIIEYIVHNGVMKDFSVLQETPFSDMGSIVDIFNDLSVWLELKRTIESINHNAISISA